MTTSTAAMPTRTASEARRRVVPPPCGPRSRERTRWLHGRVADVAGTDVSLAAVGGRGGPHDLHVGSDGPLSCGLGAWPGECIAAILSGFGPPARDGAQKP